MDFRSIFLSWLRGVNHDVVGEVEPKVQIDNVDVALSALDTKIDEIKTQIDKMTFTGDDLNTNGTFSGTIGDVKIQDSTNTYTLDIDSDGAAKVKQSGRNVVSEQAHARDTRQAYNTSNVLNRPDGAVGLFAYLIIYGSTGTFGAGEGAILSAYGNAPRGVAAPFGTTLDALNQTNYNNAIIWYPGISMGDITVGVYRDTNIVPVPVANRVSVNLTITGTFGVGEGIDCEVAVEWLY